MKEEWKIIEDFPNYEVSNMGRVRNRNTGRIRLLQNATNGYKKINLSRNGVVFWELVHRLVATAFIPNPDNLPMINHKDENKSNNNVDNLEWCTSSYNTDYSKSPRYKTLFQCNDNGDIIAKWVSTREAERKLGIDSSAISKCCRGVLKHAGGFVWKYAE